MIRFLKGPAGPDLVRRLEKEIGDPQMQALLRSWLRLAPAGGLPDKARFDPLDHAGLLPRMWIYELTADRGDFVGRLCGEEIRLVWGRTIKGELFSRIATPERFRAGHRRWLYCVTAPAVLVGRSLERGRFAVTRLTLPFTDRDGRLYVLGASRYDFDVVDVFAEGHPYRHSQRAVAVRAADLLLPAEDDQAAISSRTWAAQASPSA